MPTLSPQPVLVLVLCWCFMLAMASSGQRSCLDMAASSSSASASFPLCCQCTHHPVWFHCSHRCQQNMYPAKNEVTQCAAQFLPTSPHPAFSISWLPQGSPIHGGSLEGSTSVVDATHPAEADVRLNTGHSSPQVTPSLLSSSRPYNLPPNSAGKGQAVSVRNQVSVTCGSCDVACDGCRGPGPSRCLRCSAGYQAHSVDRALLTCKKMNISLPDTSENSQPHLVVLVSLCLSASVLTCISSYWVILRSIRKRQMKKRLEGLEKHKHWDPAATAATSAPLLSLTTPSSGDLESALHPPGTVLTELDDGTSDYEYMESMYTDIESTYAGVSAEAEKTPLAHEKRQTSSLSCIREAHRPSGTAASQALPAGFLSLWREQGRKEPTRFAFPSSYCDYRTLLFTKVEETNPKMPMPALSLPVTTAARVEQRGRDSEFPGPPLPPRNKMTATEYSSMEEEASDEEMSSSSSLSDISSLTRGGELEEKSSGIDKPAAESQTASMGMMTSACYQHIARKRSQSLDQQDYGTRGEENTAMKVQEICPVYVSLPSSVNTEKQKAKGRKDFKYFNYLRPWRRPPSPEDTGSGFHDSSDLHPPLSLMASASVALSSCLDLPSSWIKGEKFPGQLWRGSGGDILIHSCSSQRGGDTLSSLSSCFHGHPASFPSLVYSSLDSDIGCTLDVSSISSVSSGYKTQKHAVSPAACSPSPEAACITSGRQAASTGTILDSHTIQAEDTRIPSSASPAPILPGQRLSTKGLLQPAGSPTVHKRDEVGFRSFPQPLAGSEREDPSGPLFSACWQTEQGVTQQGGVVHTEGSAVQLDVPPGAVPSGESVKIKAAISTSLDQAYGKLSLPDDEYIVSPIAEYFAGVGFKFRKPVGITLPHFLPQNCSPHHVTVYVVHQGAKGRLCLEKLKRQSSDSEEADDTNVFRFLDDKHLEICTDHFSSYLCTCNSLRVATELNLVVFAGSVLKTRGGCDVDVRLEIWDNRLEVKDFEQACFARGQTAKEQKLEPIDRHSLAAPAQQETDLQTALIACHLDLKTDAQCRLWTHATRRQGQLIYQARQTLPLKDMFACNCHRPILPRRVNWKLTTASGVAASTDLFFEALVDVGYVHSAQVQDNTPGSFLTDPPPVTLDVTVAPPGEDETRSTSGSSNTFTGAGQTSRRGGPAIPADPGSGQAVVHSQHWSAPPAMTADPPPPAEPPPPHPPHPTPQLQGNTGREGFAELDVDRSVYTDPRHMTRTRPGQVGLGGVLPAAPSSQPGVTVIYRADVVNLPSLSSPEAGSAADSSFPTSSGYNPSFPSSASSDYPMPSAGSTGESDTGNGRVQVTHRAGPAPSRVGEAEDRLGEKYSEQVSDPSDSHYEVTHTC